MKKRRNRLGAFYCGGGECEFHVWAPLAQKVEVHVVFPEEQIIPLDRSEEGYHHARAEGVEPGHRYLYRLDDREERPDPASRFQPLGVHHASQVTDPRFPWGDNCWFGIPLRDYIIYELHVGTFTEEGTFEAIEAYLDYLKNLGITAIELMPVGQFPGDRNWGYDGTYPFAVQNSYGGPDALKRLVDLCHIKGLAVILDVVYNHLGPEGNYLRSFGPYFTDRYGTPWGEAINFDGPHSDHVRRFFTENALYWLTEFHMDALRIDAVHAILDFSSRPFLEELGLAVRKAARRVNRQLFLMPESALNDSRIIRSRETGGFGLDAQWNDDFHHALHALLTEERFGYYEDFGRFQDLVVAYRDGFVYSGQYSSYRKRRHGRSSRDIPSQRFIVFSQNHDQVGNRMQGERLSELVPFEALKLAAGTVLLSPFIPLLFMGEEYGEMSRFPYFISHQDPDLTEAVRKGRCEEFAAFHWQGEPPDPQSEQTFRGAKLTRGLKTSDKRQHQTLTAFYLELIRLRKDIEALCLLSKENMEVTGHEPQKVLYVRRWSDDDEVFMYLNYGAKPVSLRVNVPAGSWEKRMDSAEQRWLGPGSSVPSTIHSQGERELSLQPYGLLLFCRDKKL